MYLWPQTAEKLSRSFIVFKKLNSSWILKKEEEEEVEAQSGHHRTEPVEGMELWTHHHLAQVPAEVLANILQGGDGAGPGKTQRGHVRWATACWRTQLGGVGEGGGAELRTCGPSWPRRCLA